MKILFKKSYTALLWLSVSLLLAVGCKENAKEQGKTVDAPAEKIVKFEFSEKLTENEAEGIVTHQLNLYHGDKKYNLGRVTGGVEILAADRFADYGIPAEALAAAGVHYGGDNYYYAIMEAGSLKFYFGGPYVDENGELKYEWQKGEPMLLGRWESKESPEFWVFYDVERFFSDGNEEGTLYQIKNNAIVFDDIENKIVKLSDTELVEQSAYGSQTTVWVKADL